jgi:hypothetical protein
MANIQTEKIVQLPKPVLDQAAQHAAMPNAELATKSQIAEWLVTNQPETAKTLADTGKLPF